MKKLAVGCAALIAALATTPASAITIFGIDLSGRLVTFDSAAPGVLTSSKVISGAIGSGILGIDFRPATGELFALGANGTLYTINTLTAAATAVGAGGIPLPGSNFGFGFNPTVDRIRLVSESGQNLRLNPATGGIAATDGSYTYAGGAVAAISAVGYTNSFAGATTTTLYGIDYLLDTLVTMPLPNGGMINTIGALGFDVDGDASFDITVGGIAYLSSGINFYSVNLTTGAATFLGVTDGGLRSFTVQQEAVGTVPEPASWALMLLGFGAVGYGMRRRTRVTARVSFAA